ncbi:TNF receptor-associated factor 5-like [Hydra vulgaris]|uniref:TNF receptor-associated factor 5-like n=1 Tax=Hydra vulgaris TaxID=6087 RepID=A0ABM4CHL3_HYDVU
MIGLISTVRQKATDKLLNLIGNVKLVEKTPLSLCCHVCKKILIRPVQWNCGHRSCESCFRSGIYCEEDNETVLFCFTDNQALKEILNLSCYCLYENDGCHWNGFCHELEEHLKTCSFVETLECPYKVISCKVIGSKKTISNHQIQELVYHSALLSVFFKFEGESLMMLKSKFSDLKEYEYLFSYKYDNGFNVDKLSSEIVTLNKKRNSLKKFQSFVDDIDRIEQQIKYLVSFFNKNSFTENLHDAENRVARAEIENELIKTRLNDIRYKILLINSVTNDGSYLWKIDNFSKKLEDALAGRTIELFSPPLMTDPSGYRFCAIVMLAGDLRFNKYSQNFISVYISILPSPFDEVLTFPFPYKIDISLVSVIKGKQNHTQRLKPDENIAFQKPYQPMNQPVGFCKFCSHDNLYSGGYIKDDAIFIKFNVMK